MKNKRALILVFAFSVINVFGDIITCNKIENILQYKNSDTLFVFDLNDTLMQSTEYVGSDAWATAEMEKEMLLTGKSKFEVYGSFMPKWHELILHLIDEVETPYFRVGRKSCSFFSCLKIVFCKKSSPCKQELYAASS